MTFFLKYDVVSPKKIWGHLQTPLFTYKITYLAPLCRVEAGQQHAKLGNTPPPWRKTPRTPMV